MPRKSSSVVSRHDTEVWLYKTALGIEVGDLLTTSYGTGPEYVKDIHGPYVTSEIGTHLVLLPSPQISVSLQKLDMSKHDWRGINGIRQDGNRWLTFNCSEVFIEKPAVRVAMQIDMFQSYPSTPPLYQRDKDVDYSIYAWKCCKCDRDFNWKPTTDWAMATCPYCCHWTCKRLIELPDPSWSPTRLYGIAWPRELMETGS